MCESQTDCLFCKIIEDEIPADRIYEDSDYIAIRDINPQAPTHILIIPKRHIPTVNDIESEEKELIGGMFLVAAQLANDEGCAAEGYRALFNCNAGAGQTVFHIHLHLLGGRPLGWPPG